MVLFALSCFGLLLFLWLAFGGPIPLKPKGYQFQVAFAEARAAGHAVRRPRRRRADRQGRARSSAPDGNATHRDARDRPQVRADRRGRAGDAAQQDAARPDLRRADARRRRAAPKVPEGGLLDARNVKDDRRARRDPQHARPVHAPGVPDVAAGRRARRSTTAAPTSTTRSATCPSSSRPAATCSRCSTSSSGALGALVRNTGVVFGALTEREDQLREPRREHRHGLHRDPARARGLRRALEHLPDVPRASRGSTYRAARALRARHAPARRRTSSPALRDLRPTLRRARRRSRPTSSACSATSTR